MSRLSPVFQGVRALAVLLLAAWSIGLHHAVAEEVSFKVEVDGETRSAINETSMRNGVAYVPIASIARQIGVGVNVGTDQLQVDFQTRTALIKYSGREVNASLSQFSLARPVIHSGSEAWMALEDVESFFSNAFRLTVRRAEAAPTDSKAELDALEPLDTEAAAPARDAAGPDPAEEAPLEPISEEDLLGSAQPATPIALAPQPTSVGPVVILDPGHGGNDGGIVGRSISEKDLDLSIALKLKALLEETPGLTVRLTREDDREVSLMDRINFAIANRGRLFVSLHAGSSLSPSANGSEIYYPTDSGLTTIGLTGAESVVNAADRRTNAVQSRRIAENMATALTSESPAGQRGTRAIRSRLLHNVPMPSLLIEVGFLTNPTEEVILATDAYQESLVRV